VNVLGLAVDWITSNVYWTNEELGEISVSSSNGQFAVAIHKERVNRPLGIAVDPLNRLDNTKLHQSLV